MRAVQLSLCFLLTLTPCAGAPKAAAQDCSACWSDLNGNGRVGESDLGILLANWGVECGTAWVPDDYTVALWYLNGTGTDFSGNHNDLAVKCDRVGWTDDAPHCKGVLMGADPWEGDCSNSDGGALTAPGSGCTYPGTGDWTIEAWVYFPSNGTSYTVVSHFSDPPAENHPYSLRIDNGQAQFEINNTLIVSADVSNYNGQWIHLAGVYRNQQQDAAVWLNGDRFAIEPTAVVPEQRPQDDVYVGGTFCATSTGLKIDEVRIASMAGSPGWNLFVACREPSRLLRVDAVTGGCLDTFTHPDLRNPGGLVVGPNGNLYVTSTDPDAAVLRFDIQTSQFEVCASDCGLEDPIGLTFGPEGDLYVVGHSPQQVVRFEGDCGECLGQFTSGPACVNPSDLAFGPDGYLYVTCSAEDAVQVYDGTTGEFVRVLPCAGLDHPNGLEFGPDGDLYICSGSTNEVLRYNFTAEECAVFVPAGTLNYPGYLEFGPDGNLYVSSTNSNEVLRYAGDDGRFLGVFASCEELATPWGLAFARVQE